MTVPEVHYQVKHSPYKSELVRYGQFIFNDASWSLQGEYACASCHYERGQTTGVVWDLGDEGWEAGRTRSISGVEGICHHSDMRVHWAPGRNRRCNKLIGQGMRKGPGVCVQEREFFSREVRVAHLLYPVA